MKPYLNTPRQDHWLKNKAGTTPASTQIHPDFLSILSTTKLDILDLGCGNGRITSKLARKHHMVGIDINEAEIQYAKARYPNIRFLVGSAEAVPFEDKHFDTVITLGLFGGIDRLTRRLVMKEIYRVLKPGGYVYLGEFGRITDPKATTSTGKAWMDVYQHDVSETGEYGSVIVHPEDPSRNFVAHHFSEADIWDTVNGLDFEDAQLERVFTVSMVSGEKRPNWNAWFKKP